MRSMKLNKMDGSNTHESFLTLFIKKKLFYLKEKSTELTLILRPACQINNRVCNK